MRDGDESSPDEAPAGPPAARGADDLDPRWDGAEIPEEHWHFHRQLLERYRIVLWPGEYGAIRRAIRKARKQRPSEATLIEAHNGAWLYGVRTETTMTRIFVLAAGEALLTAWPPSKKLRVREKLLRKAAAAKDQIKLPTREETREAQDFSDDFPFERFIAETGEAHWIRWRLADVDERATQAAEVDPPSG